MNSNHQYFGLVFLTSILVFFVGPSFLWVLTVTSILRLPMQYLGRRRMMTKRLIVEQFHMVRITFNCFHFSFAGL